MFHTIIKTLFIIIYTSSVIAYFIMFIKELKNMYKRMTITELFFAILLTIVGFIPIWNTIFASKSFIDWRR